MPREQLKEELKEVIREQLNIDDEINDETLIKEQLGADSLDMVELIMAIEDKYGITIADDESEKISTFKHIIDFVEKKIS